MAVEPTFSKTVTLLCLQEMAQSIAQILSYTKAVSFPEFVSNTMLCDAVQRQFEILGEATSHVPFSIQKKFKDIPWSMMYSLRNHIAHEYFDVDYEILWEIIQHDLPNDLENLKQMQKQLPSL